MTNPASNANRDGIDLRDALEILSLRSTGTISHSTGSETTKAATPCQCHSNVPAEATGWGQRVDLTGSDENDNSGANDDSIEARRAKIEVERAQRRIEMNNTLASMSVKELLECVASAQTERVGSYRTYDRGLDDVLKTGNMTGYPSVCAEVTASFSVLSDTINSVRSTLSDKHHRKDLVTIIDRIQNGEREKLNLTAALHLEKLRAQAQSNANQQGTEPDTRVSSLLEQGVSTLQQKIATVVEDINEALEDLRFAIVEEDDDDQV